MRHISPIALLLSFTVLLGSTSAQKKQPEAGRKVDPQKFLQARCVDCHSGGKEAAGGRDFETLNLAGSDFDLQLKLQDIIDQLMLGTMPPEDGEQLSDAERSNAVESLTDRLAAMRRETRPPRSPIVLRRLSRREYRRTVGDLLGIDMTLFDPTAEFPGDDLSGHFDNIGEALVMSGHLMDSYLAAADQCVEKALAVGDPPEVRTWSFDEDFRQQSQLDTAHQQAFNRDFLCLYDHPWNDKAEGAYGHLHHFRSGVPVDGTYEIRVLARAMNRESPYSRKSMWIDRDEPFRMGIRPGVPALGDMENRQPIQPLLAETVIADDDFQWYTFRIPLDRGFAPRFTFENGYHDFRGMIGRLYRYDKDRLPKAALPDSRGIFQRRIDLISHAGLPHIRIDKVEIRGLVDFTWPSLSRRLLFGSAEFDESKAQSLIERFASRAFRRSATEKEVDRLLGFFTSRRDQGISAALAFKEALKAVLCSPEFLYFKQSTADGNGETRLSQHALAERLSYFLTSTMPDDRLRELADHGRLSDPETLRSEVRRLLADKASDAFVSDFLESWLNLRALGSMPPDVNKFRFFYSANLQHDMKRETRMFFRDLINRNSPVTDMISARYSFVNRDLARLYGVADQVPVETAAEFRRVTFEDRHRGGILGQASVMTVSANGIDTSPIVRGVWMLENVLGMPTPAPPDDVPAIEPDTRGATTIRDQLTRHRNNDACFQCHRKIDPLGFALEGFDAIGRARRFYDEQRKRPINTSGQLPGGDRFSGLPELKELLIKRKPFFVRTVTERLLTHALGRRVASADRAGIDQIVKSVRDRDYPAASLIEAVVLSELFAM